MGLVTSKEIAKAIKVDKLGFVGTFIGWVLMKVLRITTVNKVYNKHKHKKDLNFLNGLLRHICLMRIVVLSQFIFTTNPR